MTGFETAQAENGTLADDLSFLLARANALSLTAGNTALAAFGLKARSYAVLALAVEQSPTQRVIAEYLRLDPSQVVSIVDWLENEGLVTRRPDPRDRRANVIDATDAGRDLQRRASHATAQSERELHSALEPDELQVLTALVRKIAFPS